MGNPFRKYLIILTLLALLFPVLNVNAQTSDIHFKVDGKDFDYNDTLIIDGRTYIPVRQLSELLGANVDWDGNLKEVSIGKDNVSFKLIINEKKVSYNSQTYYMDSPALIKNDISYAPVRFVAEALHHKVVWDSTTRTVNINEKLMYTVKEGDSLFLIAEAYGVNVNQIKKWNHLTDDKIFVDQKLFLEDVEFNSLARPAFAYTDDDVRWLAKIVFAEAQDEPYDGLVAVASVVLNRVGNSDFPNTVYGVIFQPYQFTPASTGRINQIVPDQASYNAAKEALMGNDPVNGALFFYNPNASNSSFFSQKKFIKRIGNHNFYR